MKKLLLPLVLFVCLFTSAFAYSHSQDDFRRTLQYYVGLAAFNGDSHGQFTGDPVAILSDGSAWKIHPKDKEKFSRWIGNEIVHVEARTSFYWFKREHKFELRNHMRNESVRAMLVQYPTYPLMIVESHSYIADTKVEYTEYRHDDGSSTTVPTVYNIHEKRVVLNDGSAWRIRENFDSFNIGNTVYLGCNSENNRYYFFLVSGIEREAVFEWAH